MKKLKSLLPVIVILAYISCSWDGCAPEPTGPDPIGYDGEFIIDDCPKGGDNCKRVGGGDPIVGNWSGHIGQAILALNAAIDNNHVGEFFNSPQWKEVFVVLDNDMLLKLRTRQLTMTRKEVPGQREIYFIHEPGMGLPHLQKFVHIVDISQLK